MLQQPTEQRLWQDADLVTLFFGANDACLEGMPNYQHVPLELFRANLMEMIQIVWKTAPQADILLVTPPPLVDEMWRTRPTATPETAVNRTSESSRRYAEAVVQVSQATGVPVLDLAEPFGGVEPHTDLFSDGLHFSETGASLFAELMLGALAAHFGISADLPLDLPPFNDPTMNRAFGE